MGQEKAKDERTNSEAESTGAKRHEYRLSPSETDLVSKILTAVTGTTFALAAAAGRYSHTQESSVELVIAGTIASVALIHFLVRHLLLKRQTIGALSILSGIAWSLLVFRAAIAFSWSPTSAALVASAPTPVRTVRPPSISPIDFGASDPVQPAFTITNRDGETLRDAWAAAHFGPMQVGGDAGSLDKPLESRGPSPCAKLRLLSWDNLMVEQTLRKLGDISPGDSKRYMPQPAMIMGATRALVGIAVAYRDRDKVRVKCHEWELVRDNDGIHHWIPADSN